MTKIGFVGLGHMGYPMALNLIKNGFEVTGYDLNPEILKNFRIDKGIPAQNLVESSKNQDVVITMLQTGQQVKDVCFGDNGLFVNAQANTLFIDCSSIDVQSSKEFHKIGKENNLLTVDAPVSGGVMGAIQAKLTIMVGGNEEAFLQAKPILSLLGKKIIHTGSAGSGQAAKICNNMILGISMISISEAFILAEKLGLAPEKLFEVVNNSSGQCWAMSNYAPIPGLLENVPANNNYKPGFAAAMMYKDLKLSQEAAHSVDVKTQLGEKACAIYEKFIEMKQGDLDFSAIIKIISEQT